MWETNQSRCLNEGSKSEINGFMEMEGGRAATLVKVGLIPVVFVLDVGTGCPSSYSKGRRRFAGAVARGLVHGWKDLHRHKHHRAIEVAYGVPCEGQRNLDGADFSQHRAHPSMWVPAGLHISANVITLRKN